MEFITMLIWIGGFFVIVVGASGGNLLWKAQSFLAPKEAVSPRFLDIKRPPIRWRCKEVMVKFCQYRENGHGNQALIYFSDWFVDLLTVEDVWGQNSA